MYILTTLEFPTHNINFHLLQILPSDWLSYSLSVSDIMSDYSWFKVEQLDNFPSLSVLYRQLVD